MPRWDVQLFGGLRIRCGDLVISKFRTRATDSVFAYLALHLEQGVSRDELAEVGWPNVDIEKARQSLRMALTSIRSVLGASAIESDRDRVRLTASVSTDVDAFRRTRNLDLYCGPLLSGMKDSWISPIAHGLEEDYFQAVIAAMNDLTPSEARLVGERAFRLDPSRLEIRRKLRSLGVFPDLEPRPTGPVNLTSFVGRQRELREIEVLLKSHRLITLSGLGGSGKTRLGAELWRRWQPDAWFVSLADLSNPFDVPEAIRQGLRLPQFPQNATDQICSALCDEAGLLVLDNFEHVIPASGFVSEILNRCPHLHVVLTSQLTLGLSGEIEYLVGPLSLSTDEAIPMSDSMILFEERARSVVPSFEITQSNAKPIEELCRRLDGFPLALEIAAAKSRIFTPFEMLHQLEQRFAFLSKKGEDSQIKHSSMRTTLDWSFDRLSEENQALLTELSIFRGGFTIKAAEVILERRMTDGLASALEGLLAQSWIERTPGPETTRFRLLECIRDYGSELLRPSTRVRLSASHASYYLKLARSCGGSSFTPEEPHWHQLVEDDIHNLDAAWNWLIANDPEGAMGLAEGLNWYWVLKGLSYVGEARIKLVLEMVDPTPRSKLAWANHACGNFILFQGRHAESLKWFHKSLNLSAEVGDDLLTGLALCQMAQVAAELGDYDSAMEQAERSLRLLVGQDNQNWIGAGHVIVNLAANRLGYLDKALESGLESVRNCRTGGYPWGLASALNELAMACHLRGDYAQALRYQEESISIKRDTRAPRSLALSLIDQTSTLIDLGEIEAAKTSIKEGLQVLTSIKGQSGFPHLFGIAAHLFCIEGKSDLAAASLSIMVDLATPRGMNHFERLLESSVRQRIGTEACTIPLEWVAQQILAL